MSETKTCSIAAILTVTTGNLMCDIGDVYEILGWLTGEDLMTHQLPRASRESEAFLREQFPDLAAVESPDWTATPGWEQMSTDDKRAKITDWLDGIAATAGATREVPRLPAEDHTSIDPFAELRMMRPDLPIIAVQVDGDPS